MNLHSTIWRFIIMLLCFSIQRCPPLPAGSQSLNHCGSLTVEPAPLFVLGSNLTVYCHYAQCQQRSKIVLVLNGETVDHKEKVNSTTMMFHLVNVRVPLSVVHCKMKRDSWNDVVAGADLQGGRPPDKPTSVTCETSRSSHFIDCSWERGQETHLLTSYNISVSRENGTQRLLEQIQNAGKVNIPRAMIDEDTKYWLLVTAHNRLGASQSDPVVLSLKDIVIPETPRITQVQFGNNLAALLEWNTSESSEYLSSYVRLSAENSSWKAGRVTDLQKGLIQVDELKPLTEYEFQIKICLSGMFANPPSFMPMPATIQRSYCSKWSPSVRGRSPGKGPSQQLQVWRVFGALETNGLRMVTVLWKPPSREDYSGEVQQYKIFNGQKKEMTCGAALSQCTVQVPAEVQVLSISAVTLYGASPPAVVPLRHSGEFGPVLRELAPTANRSAMLVSWSWPGNQHRSTPGGELLYYVVEWRSTHVTGLQWQKVAKDENCTSITGLTAGVRYEISLYAVTTSGVSAPTSSLTYSKEEKPLSGPNLSVLVHEARRIQIQWDELPVNQQKGFITNYTIYLQTLDSGNVELNVTVPGYNPRRKWLDCPEGALALQVSASTSAGEGPRGSRISSQPAGPAVGLVIMTVFITCLFVVIIINLMSCHCVRKRIKQTCIAWRPGWFNERLPNPDNSVAIRLLKQDKSESTFSSTYNDPPLSPISVISEEERDNLYPNVHVKTSQQPTAGTSLLMTDSGTMLADSQLEDVGYKPQIAVVALHQEDAIETEEEQKDMPTSGEEDRCSSVFGGLLGDLLSSVKVDISDSHFELTLSSVSCPLMPETPERTSVLNGGFLLGRRGTENDEDANFSSLDSRQGEIRNCGTEDTCLSQYTAETKWTGGYFPQVASVSSSTLCDTQR